jgi:hypothetical protein
MPRSKASPQQASEDDEAKGRAMYEQEAANWPKPIGWDNLPEGSKYLWIQRAMKGHN